MSRRRYLSTKISQDAKINKLATQAGDFAALLYTWMIPHAEDDGTLSGDPEEVLMTVVPGRRDKSVEDITAALTAMHDLGLIVWNRAEAHPTVAFPSSFHTYQSYITKERRKGAQADESSDAAPQTSAQRGKSAQNAAEPRTSAQNAASFSSSSSSSFSPPTEGAASAPTDAQMADALADEAAFRANAHSQPPQDDAAIDAQSDVTSEDTHPEPTPIRQRVAPINPLWDALVEVFGYEPRTPPERSKWGKIIKHLKEAHATPDDVRRVKANYDAGVELGVYAWSLTPNAVDTHLGELLQPPRAPTPSRPRASPAAVGAGVRREPPAFRTADQAKPVGW